jgi:spore coat polysaccharide biosynthesis predicted glycosyltransferase SpsG
VLAIDDTGEGAPWTAADAILNQNLHASEALYATRAPATALMLGPRWALLRREFAPLAANVRSAPETAQRILVSFGGSDPAGMAPRAARALSRLGSGVHVAIVAGLADPRGARIPQEPADGVEIVSRPRDFARLLADADLAVVAAGTTCWELACLGVPFLAVATAPNQVEIAASLQRVGVARDTGWHADLSEERLRAEVLALVPDAGLRRRMSEAGRALVDGHGAARVAARLAEAKAA